MTGAGNAGLMGRLSARVALVTGASAGIGAATARQLAAEGATLLLVARRGELLTQLCAELQGAVAVVADVRDNDAFAAAVAAALPAGRSVEIAVLNAGLARGTDPVAEGNPTEWTEMIDTNVKGVLHGLKTVMPAMVAAGDGHVVLVGSVAGRQVYPGGTVYCATKAAVKAIYEGARLDTLGCGVRFTTVDPGMVETDFSEVRFRGDAARAAAVYQGVAALQANDVADAILYALTRPHHVDVGEIVLWPTDQASVRDVKRDATG